MTILIFGQLALLLTIIGIGVWLNAKYDVDSKIAPRFAAGSFIGWLGALFFHLIEPFATKASNGGGYLITAEQAQFAWSMFPKVLLGASAIALIGLIGALLIELYECKRAR